MDVVGIDISKLDFHACLLQGDSGSRKTFPNNKSGYTQFRHWLKNRRCVEVHACMEATGAYWEGLATALHGFGMHVSVVNPSRTSAFARSQMRRTKTDREDSEMIADFCRTQNPSLWKPPSQETQVLRGLLSYRDALVAQKTVLVQMVQQIHAGKELKALHVKQIKALEKSLGALEREMKTLVAKQPAMNDAIAKLESIKSIGFVTAVSLIAYLPMERLRSARAAAAYSGLTPRDWQSGTSVHGRPRICKTGSSQLRRAVYMAAVVARRFNPILRDFGKRLEERGKPSKVIIVAIMRKLVVLAYNILRQTLPTPAPAMAVNP